MKKATIEERRAAREAAKLQKERNDAWIKAVMPDGFKLNQRVHRDDPFGTILKGIYVRPIDGHGLEGLTWIEAPEKI